MIYTSRSTFPYAVISNIHYAELTDMTWSTEGQIKLAISSRDGFVSLVAFEDEELGRVLPKSEMPELIQPLFDWMDNTRDLTKCDDQQMEEIQPTFKSRKTAAPVDEAPKDVVMTEEK